LIQKNGRRGRHGLGQLWTDFLLWSDERKWKISCLETDLIESTSLWKGIQVRVTGSVIQYMTEANITPEHYH